MDHVYVKKLYDRKDFGAIKRFAITALKEKPLNAQSWLYLSEALQAMKRTSDSYHAYRRAVLLDPVADWVNTKKASFQGVQIDPPSDWLETMLSVPVKSVSAAVIVKNGERTIEKSLQSLIPAVDEIIVVDTGSTDRTLEIVASLGLPVHHFEWCDDFSAARNFALSKVTKDWVLCVDSDEILLEDDIDAPRTVAGMLDHVQEPLLCRIVQLNQMPYGLIPEDSMYRFFPTGRGIRYWGRIHEQPHLVPLDFKGMPEVATALVGIRVLHDGYNEQIVDMGEKIRRNITLLEKNVEANPEDIGSLGFLSREYYAIREDEKALATFQRLEQLADSFPSYGRISADRYLYCELLFSLDRVDEAHTVAKRCVEADPDFPDGWFSLAQAELLIGARNIKKAQEYFRKTYDLIQSYRGVVTSNKTISSWRLNLGLADANRMQGNLFEAREIYQSVLKEHPTFSVVKQQLKMIDQQKTKLSTVTGR